MNLRNVFRNGWFWGAIMLGPLSALSATVALPDPPVIQGGNLQNVVIRAVNTEAYELPFGNPADPAAESVAVQGLYLYQTTPCLGCSRASLLPARLAVRQGQQVKVRFDNALQGVPAGESSDSNLHTHGAMVAPTHPRGACDARGDDIFVISQANGGTPTCVDHGSHDMGGDSMQMARGSLRYEYRFPLSHPSGLNWYHPHVHGFSEVQVGGGMAGLLTVGYLWDDAFITCAPFGSRAAYERPYARCGSLVAWFEEMLARSKVLERFMMLKDIQIQQRGPRQYVRAVPYDKVMCGTGSQHLGYCTNAGGDTRWVFTVNGVAYPTVTVEQSRPEVWRMANASPDVTYRLQLVVTRGTTQLPAGTVLPLRVLSQDGATLDSETAAGPIAVSTLMPGARTEWLLDACAMGVGVMSGQRRCTVPTEVVAELRTLGADTAANPGDADTWPTLPLAEVRFLPSPGARGIVPLNSVAPLVSGGEAPAVAAVAEAVAPASTRMAMPTAPMVPACAPDVLQPGQVRVIRFNNGILDTGERFGLRAEKSALVLPADPDRIDLPDLTPTPDLMTDYSRMGDANSKARLCIRYGQVERWVLVNDSQECHNFHIHQMRFKVRRIQPGGTPADAQCLGDRAKAVQADSWLDNFPVPPGARVLIDMPFTRPEQVGKFVYHCHILEHEDKGMMAVIEVVR